MQARADEIIVTTLTKEVSEWVSEWVREWEREREREIALLHQSIILIIIAINSSWASGSASTSGRNDGDNVSERGKQVSEGGKEGMQARANEWLIGFVWWYFFPSSLPLYFFVIVCSLLLPYLVFCFFLFVSALDLSDQLSSVVPCAALCRVDYGTHWCRFLIIFLASTSLILPPLPSFLSFFLLSFSCWPQRLAVCSSLLCCTLLCWIWRTFDVYSVLSASIAPTALPSSSSSSASPFSPRSLMTELEIRRNCLIGMRTWNTHHCFSLTSFCLTSHPFFHPLSFFLFPFFQYLEYRSFSRDLTFSFIRAFIFFHMLSAFLVGCLFPSIHSFIYSLSILSLVAVHVDWFEWIQKSWRTQHAQVIMEMNGLESKSREDNKMKSLVAEVNKVLLAIKELICDLQSLIALRTRLQQKLKEKQTRNKQINRRNRLELDHRRETPEIRNCLIDSLFVSCLLFFQCLLYLHNDHVNFPTDVNIVSISLFPLSWFLFWLSLSPLDDVCLLFWSI